MNRHYGGNIYVLGLKTELDERKGKFEFNRFLLQYPPLSSDCPKELGNDNKNFGMEIRTSYGLPSIVTCSRLSFLFHCSCIIV